MKKVIVSVLILSLATPALTVRAAIAPAYEQKVQRLSAAEIQKEIDQNRAQLKKVQDRLASAREVQTKQGKRYVVVGLGEAISTLVGLGSAIYVTFGYIDVLLGIEHSPSRFSGAFKWGAISAVSFASAGIFHLMKKSAESSTEISAEEMQKLKDQIARLDEQYAFASNMLARVEQNGGNPIVGQENATPTVSDPYFQKRLANPIHLPVQLSESILKHMSLPELREELNERKEDLEKVKEALDSGVREIGENGVVYKIANGTQLIGAATAAATVLSHASVTFFEQWRGGTFADGIYKSFKKIPNSVRVAGLVAAGTAGLATLLKRSVDKTETITVTEQEYELLLEGMENLYQQIATLEQVVEAEEQKEAVRQQELQTQQEEREKVLNELEKNERILDSAMNFLETGQKTVIKDKEVFTFNIVAAGAAGLLGATAGYQSYARHQHAKTQEAIGRAENRRGYALDTWIHGYEERTFSDDKLFQEMNRKEAALRKLERAHSQMVQKRKENLARISSLVDSMNEDELFKLLKEEHAYSEKLNQYKKLQNEQSLLETKAKEIRAQKQAARAEFKKLIDSHNKTQKKYVKMMQKRKHWDEKAHKHFGKSRFHSRLSKISGVAAVIATGVLGASTYYAANEVGVVYMTPEERDKVIEQIAEAKHQIYILKAMLNS